MRINKTKVATLQRLADSVCGTEGCPRRYLGDTLVCARYGHDRFVEDAEHGGPQPTMIERSGGTSPPVGGRCECGRPCFIIVVEQPEAEEEEDYALPAA